MEAWLAVRADCLSQRQHSWQLDRNVHSCGHIAWLVLGPARGWVATRGTQVELKLCAVSLLQWCRAAIDGCLFSPAPLPIPPDNGFDPLGLGSSPEQLAWNTHAEIFHGRLAMTGVAGILLTSLLHTGGANVPEWYEAGKVYLERNPNVSFGALLYTTILFSGFVEFKRLADIRNPGSQGSGILPADFKGTGGPQGRTEGGPYVGGRFFDPMGLWCVRLSRKTPATGGCCGRGCISGSLRVVCPCPAASFPLVLASLLCFFQPRLS